MASSNAKFSRLLLSSLLVLLFSTPIVVLLLSLQTGPSVAVEASLTRAEIASIEQLLLENSPQSPTNSGQQQVHLDAHELNLLARYGIEVLGLSPNWLAQASLADGLLTSQLSVRVTQRFQPLYLNLRAEFSVQQGSLHLDNLYFGELQVPQRFLQYALEQIREEVASSNSAYQDISELLQSVDSVAINDDQLTVMLNWDPELLSRITNQAQQLFISEKDQQLIAAHYLRIADVASTIPADLRAVSLNTFLIPMFATAHDNAVAGSDPVAENRTLFQALAVYVNDEDIAQLIGAEKAALLTHPRKIEVRLQRRQDLAQHLVSIAAITASAGADIAEMLSTTKEAYDARYRSGFSFSDLTANTVGVLIARLATQDRSTALLMQERLAQLTSEAEYMPTVGSNQDGLSETDFNAQYQDRSSQEYQRRVAEIETMVAEKPLFQGLQ
jgi:hypothetical protein